MDILALHQWFKETRRSFPWRENPTPYRVWISEVMLQQTRASVVIPYFERWMEMFPDPHVLARAPLESVIKAWEDCENNCSFWQSFPQLAQHLPPEVNLIVKLHPNTIAQHTLQIERMMGRYESGQLQFLLDFPPIYPLLDRCDAYLGDRSSIGYDFLFFDRPMFFLHPHRHRKGRDLTRCGMSVTPEIIFDCWLKSDHQRYFAIRQSMKEYAFDFVSLEKLRLINEIGCHPSRL